jgi:hypothetical protein
VNTVLPHMHARLRTARNKFYNVSPTCPSCSTFQHILENWEISRQVDPRRRDTSQGTSILSLPTQLYLRLCHLGFSVIIIAKSSRILRVFTFSPERVCAMTIPTSIHRVALFTPARVLPGVTDTLRWMLYRRANSSSRFTDLTDERIRNIAVMDKFGLDPNRFNHKLYWLTLHSWMLHQRFLVEKLSKLESDYVDRIWLMPYKWMMDKGIPRHRLQVELEHSHRHSLKFCVDLDQAISRADILPGQIAEVLWKSMYAEDGKVRSAGDPRVVRLTKYVIRNLNFILNNVPVDNFTQGAFKWPAEQ